MITIADLQTLAKARLTEELQLYYIELEREMLQKLLNKKNELVANLTIEFAQRLSINAGESEILIKVKQ